MREENKMKSVPVDLAAFSEIVFKGATAKEEFGQKGVQKRRGDVPVWAVKVAVCIVAPNGRTDDDFITVTVPSHSDPAQDFQRGDDVTFDRLQFGVADTKTGYSLWFSADAITPAVAGATARVA